MYKIRYNRVQSKSQRWLQNKFKDVKQVQVMSFLKTFFNIFKQLYIYTLYRKAYLIK